MRFGCNAIIAAVEPPDAEHHLQMHRYCEPRFVPIARMTRTRQTDGFEIELEEQGKDSSNGTVKC